MPIALLDTHSRPEFPALHRALLQPNGLLAVGGQLSPEWLIAAYQRGIFPWFSSDDPILWWSPDPRAVLYPGQQHCSRSLKKWLRQQRRLHLSLNQAFTLVINHCAAHSAQRPSTWISPKMQQAYTALHHQGLCHSLELWQDQQLIAGLYGVALGRVFFGESMFGLRTNASKVVLLALSQLLHHWQFSLIDCQVHSLHLQSLGACCIRREDFAEHLANNPAPLPLLAQLSQQPGAQAALQQALQQVAAL